MIGVAGGLAAALGSMHAPASVYLQTLALLGAGGAVGNYIARTMKITDLPQMVAAFHCLVGFVSVLREWQGRWGWGLKAVEEEVWEGWGRLVQCARPGRGCGGCAMMGRHGGCLGLRNKNQVAVGGEPQLW
jgi:hypothetical protein